MIDIQKNLTAAKAILADVQAAITAREHIAQTPRGPVPTGQLVTAAGFCGQLITALANHETALANAIKNNTPPAPPAEAPAETAAAPAAAATAK